MRGINDKPIQSDREDQLSVKSYVEGLCSFIKECDTPVSIAVQGDWGCGKTSMMNMVRNNLEKEKRFQCVWFDTWQFSQFHMETQMALIFMHHFINSFEGRKEEAAVLGKTKGLLKALAVGAAKQAVGDLGAAAVENALQREETTDFSREIVELKKSFQELIASRVKDADGRVLFFVDDLDRLQPVTAVELLEILKVFFDCERCVFILAVDTEVIFQGIKEKYGDFISDEKAKCFFDKIIQLPFQLPVSHYKTAPMIERAFRVEISSYYDREWYYKAVYLLTGGNPRSIKRLSNAFLLTDKVAESKALYVDDKKETDVRKKILFILTGIQLNYPETYAHIVFNSSYGFFYSLSLLSGTDDRERMRRKLIELKFSGKENWTERFLDVMLLFVSTLQKYISSGLDFFLYPFMRVCDFSRIVNMDEREERWIQPESDDNERIDETGALCEFSDPHEMYLYDRMDQVLSFHFRKEDEGDWTTEDFTFDYKYYLRCRAQDAKRKPEDLGQKNWKTDWLFSIEFWNCHIFPTVHLNETLLEKEHPLHQEILRLQSNLSFWYGKLQEEYGEKAYPEKNFSGREFLVYSEKQADLLVQDLLAIASKVEEAGEL